MFKRYSCKIVLLQKPSPVVLHKYSNTQIIPAKSLVYDKVSLKDIKHIKLSVDLPVIKGNFQND